MCGTGLSFPVRCSPEPRNRRWDSTSFSSCSLASGYLMTSCFWSTVGGPGLEAIDQDRRQVRDQPNTAPGFRGMFLPLARAGMGFVAADAA